MTKFCTKCGKKLEDGKPCDCESKENKKVEEVEVVSNTASNYVNDYLDALKGIFTKPVDTMKKYAKSSNFILSLIMIGINSIVFGLFAFFFAKESVNLVASLSGYGSLMRGYSIDVPISVFFIAVLLMAVFFFCLSGLLHLIGSALTKKESDFKAIMGLIGVNSIFTTITTLVAFVFLFLSKWITMLIIAIAGIIYLLNTYHGFVGLTKIDKNKICYVFTGAYVVTLFLVCYVLPKIFG